jgi:uncharacterized protein YxjI
VSDLLTRDRLVFRQKVKLIELQNEFKIWDESGAEIGTIRQEGQSKLKKVARFVSSLDQFMTHNLVVYDGAGTKVCELVRPRKFVKSRVIVKDGVGRQAGEIVQANVFGKIRFDLRSVEGQGVGQIRAENWRAWNFSIVDATEHEIGRITKSWEGLAKTLFTTADNYVLEIDPSVDGDLRLFALASAVGVDTALKQDARGIDFT